MLQTWGRPGSAGDCTIYNNIDIKRRQIPGLSPTALHGAQHIFSLSELFFKKWFQKVCFVLEQCWGKVVLIAVDWKRVKNICDQHLTQPCNVNMIPTKESVPGREELKITGCHFDNIVKWKRNYVLLWNVFIFFIKRKKITWCWYSMDLHASSFI